MLGGAASSATLQRASSMHEGRRRRMVRMPAVGLHDWDIDHYLSDSHSARRMHQ